MSDETKDPNVDQKKRAEEDTQLSEEALGNVTGGDFSAGFAAGAAQGVSGGIYLKVDMKLVAIK
jgi:hypothetical protein